jgi:hypothetical protein
LQKLFERAAFEPTDAELDVSGVHVDPLDISWEVDETTGEGKYTAKVIKKKPRRSFVDDEFSDLDDFIVNDDEADAEYKPGKTVRHRKARPQAHVIISDDEDESDDDLEAIRDRSRKDSKAVINLDSDDDDGTEAPTKEKAGAVAPKKKVDSLVQPAMMSSFLPSTKMQYVMKYVMEIAETHPNDKVRGICLVGIFTHHDMK